MLLGKEIFVNLFPLFKPEGPMGDSKLIYSSDGSGKNLAKGKNKNRNFNEIIPCEVTLKIRIEKKGRGGKAVTVVYELPSNPPYFKKLLKELKSFCGTGGSLKGEQIEIQGDQVQKVKEFLIKKGFQVKG